MKIKEINDLKNTESFIIKVEKDVVQLHHHDYDEYESLSCSLTFSLEDYVKGMEDLKRNKSCLIKGDHGNLEIKMEDGTSSTITIYIPESMPKFIFQGVNYVYYE